MEFLLSALYTIACYLFVIFVLVFVHEFGHYIIAKCSGVKIETFSIGFGKELWGWNDKSGTRWKISAIPFGGYVKMFGDASEISNPSQEIDSYSPEQKQKTFYHKPLYKKAAIVAAGPIANFLLTIGIFTYFICTIGLASSDPVIGDVVKDSAAESAGLQKGDKILMIDKEKVTEFSDISRIIFTNINTPVTLTLERNKHIMQVVLTPKIVSNTDALGNTYKRPLIGISTKNIKLEEVGLPRAVWEATKTTYYFCTTSLKAVGQIVTGKRSFSENMQGPITIAKLSGQAAHKGWDVLLLLMANISASLGLVNLFPIPVLDGGHLLYYLIEFVQGKPLARRFQEYGLRVGMALIAMLMTSIILNDIYRWLLTFKEVAH